MSDTALPSFAEIRAAHTRIAPFIHRTPVMTCAALDAQTGARLFLKCENFQKVGAFKARGAMNAVLQLSEKATRNGVVTHSSGNHGAALAWAAGKRGLTATVVMPHNAPQAKKDAVASYGGIIVECEPTLASRLAGAEAVVAATGAHPIPPYDHVDVIAGQGTAALELFEDAPVELDAIVCPVGGGGLMAGTGIAAKALGVAQVIAAEPEAADEAARSFAAGQLLPGVAQPATIADGVRSQLCPRTFAAMQAYVDAVATVSEEAIVHAMRLVWERMKLIIEPSCALPVAALLERRWDARGKTVGVLLTGGNIDLDRLPWQPR